MRSNCENHCTDAVLGEPPSIDCMSDIGPNCIFRHFPKRYRNDTLIKALRTPKTRSSRIRKRAPTETLCFACVCSAATCFNYHDVKIDLTRGIHDHNCCKFVCKPDAKVPPHKRKHAGTENCAVQRQTNIIIEELLCLARNFTRCRSRQKIECYHVV